jgi:hypothetical protein
MKFRSYMIIRASDAFLGEMIPIYATPKIYNYIILSVALVYTTTCRSMKPTILSYLHLTNVCSINQLKQFVHILYLGIYVLLAMRKWTSSCWLSLDILILLSMYLQENSQISEQELNFRYVESLIFRSMEMESSLTRSPWQILHECPWETVHRQLEQLLHSWTRERYCYPLICCKFNTKYLT